MATNKPALIRYRNGRYEGYNEDGRLVLHRPTHHATFVALETYGYIPVDSFTSSGKMIMDKLQTKSPAMVVV